MADSTQPSPPDGLEKPARGRAMLVIVLGITLAVLDGSIVNLALPGIARELHSTAAHSIWVVNAYQIASLLLLLPLASLGERIGYRRVYLVGMAVFTVSSVGAMLADSLPTLIAARAVQGLGAAGIMSVNAAMVRLIYPRALLGRGMGINSMVVAFAAMSGPTIAAGILSVAPWPWLFALNLPLGAFTLWLGRRALPFNPVASRGARPAAIDLILNTLMFALIFIGGERLSVRGPGGAGTDTGLGLALLVAGVLVGWIYLRRQARQPVPLFPLDLLRLPVFALSMASSVGAFCAQTLAYLSLPFLLLESFGRTPLQAGLLITAWPLAIVVVAPLAGRLIGRYPDGLLGGLGMVIFAAGAVLLALLPASPSDGDMVWRMALCGVGFALFQSPNNHTIVTSAPLERSGAASGMLGTARLTGQTMGAVLLAAIFGLLPPSSGQGEMWAMWLAAGFAALAAVCSTLRVHTAAGPSH
ncbi:MFS transporter [Simplicispira psychrophila]|uniref:MFS transporter n=1 Tax=Simplicispira psychrophila TaxID=80882 RepID=UPI00047FC5E0|nr:MFS transporter [Simplicispira psychrophila]